MQALRNGFKLGGRLDSEENPQLESENESSRQVVGTNAKPLALALEPETTVGFLIILQCSSCYFPPLDNHQMPLAIVSLVALEYL